MIHIEAFEFFCILWIVWVVGVVMGRVCERAEHQ